LEDTTIIVIDSDQKQLAIHIEDCEGNILHQKTWFSA
jgi:hypothetical protein